VNFFFYRPPILPPEKRYDDVLYKFTYNGRDYISHSRDGVYFSRANV
jgi:hypothetical protein